MLVVVVDIVLRPGAGQAFMALMMDNAATSLAVEAGCHQFDVCVDGADTSKVLLYERYDDKAAFQHHLDSAHFLSFDTATATMLASKTVRLLNQVR